MLRKQMHILHKMTLCVVLTGGTLQFSLCSSNENWEEFRETAGPGVQSGLQTLLDGGEDNTGLGTIIDSLIDGFFVIVEPDNKTVDN